MTFALAMIAVCWPRERVWWQSSILFGMAMLITLLAFRWPNLLDNRQYPDPDESQFIAEASTLQHDPFFWRSVDGTTHGPITDWPLLIASFVRGSLDFTTARVVSSSLIWIELVAAFLIFRHLHTQRFAGVLVLPLLAAHAFADLWSFVAYCSEHVPNTLLAVGLFSLITAWASDGQGLPSRARLFAAGVFLGAVPFAKLQGTPIAAVCVVAGVWFLIRNQLNWSERCRSLVAFIGGVVTVPAIIVGTVLLFGIWTEFFNSYILDNLRYAGANKFPPDRSFSWNEAARMLFELGSYAQNFNSFFIWLGGFAVCGSLLLPLFSRWHRRWVALAAVATVAGICAALAPGRPYLHYLQLIIFPVGLFGGLIGGALVQDLATRVLAGASQRPMRIALVSVFLFCGLGPQFWWRATEPPRFIGRFTLTRGALARSEVSKEILRYGKPGQRLGIWGYMPVFWVETGLLQATRDAETSHQIEPHEYRNYYRDRFLRDLFRAQPPVFVDAVGAGNFVYQDRSEFGHETFPELRDYLANNYQLVRDVDGTRVYVRSDRL